NAVLNAVEDGTITEKRIDESVTRILKLKIKRGLILSDTDLIEKPDAETKEDATAGETSD
ncbi:MAG: hypothetical protein ACOCM4_08090, partial [Acetivibrio ethanolgignens]